MNDELDHLLGSWKAPPASEQFSERMDQLFARTPVIKVAAGKPQVKAWLAAAFGICVATLLWLTTMTGAPPSEPPARPANLLQSRVELRAPATSVERASVDGSRHSSIAGYRNSTTLTLSPLRVRRDGVALAEHRVGTFAAGDIVVVGLPGRGQLAFSAEPDPRVPPAGIATLDGRTLRFNLDGHDYELVSDEPVGPNGLTALSMYVSDNPGPAMDRGRLWVDVAPSIEVWLSQTRP